MFARLTLTAVFAGTAALLSASAVQAQDSYYTGNDILASCTAPTTDPVHYAKLATCRGYVAGLVDGVDFAAGVFALQNNEPETKLICVPAGVTIGQLTDVVIAYLQANPATRHRSGAAEGLIALYRAFPCST
jgi:hypothetical protein